MIIFTLNELRRIETDIGNFMDETWNLKLNERVPTKAEQDRIIIAINEKAKEMCLRESIDPDLQFRFRMAISKEGNCRMNFNWVVLK